jgi:transposase
MRKQFDGLAQVARDVIKQDPLSGHLFVFCNRRRDRLKILVWDRSGFWLLAKRLEGGTFAWPTAAPKGERRVEMSGDELSALLAGFDIARIPRRRWWRREPIVQESIEKSLVGS